VEGVKRALTRGSWLGPDTGQLLQQQGARASRQGMARSLRMLRARRIADVSMHFQARKPGAVQQLRKVSTQHRGTGPQQRYRTWYCLRTSWRSSGSAAISAAATSLPPLSAPSGLLNTPEGVTNCLMKSSGETCRHSSWSDAREGEEKA
jgi:hypothetical protein